VNFDKGDDGEKSDHNQQTRQFAGQRYCGWCEQVLTVV